MVKLIERERKRGSNIKEFDCVRTISRVESQTLGQEVLDFFRPLVRVSKRRNSSCDDQEQGPERRILHVRWLSFDHLHQHDTKTPDVSFVVESLALDVLW